MNNVQWSDEQCAKLGVNLAIDGWVGNKGHSRSYYYVPLRPQQHGTAGTIDCVRGLSGFGWTGSDPSIQMQPTDVNPTQHP